jgi:membrane dipeptidase
MLRRAFLHGLLAAGSATLMGARIAVGADTASTAGPLTADFHCHAWRRPDFAADLRQGGVNVVVMVATSDRLLLNRDSGRQRALGSVAPGALYANATEQMAAIAQAIDRNDLFAVRTPADADRAKTAGKPGIVVGFEGGDALEGNLDRLQELHAAGTRLIQLVHYRVNELGDIQTEDPVHAGLTPFGADAVRACNRLGIIVDVAHATFDVTRQTAKVTTRPLLLSHTFLTDAPRRYTRGITRDHARAVTETGGVIGVVPFPSAFPTLQDYTAGIARMADAVGMNHVGIGGDLAGIPGIPPYRRFEQFPAIIAALQGRGFSSEDIAKIAGGNFMRVFAATAATA